MQALGVFEANLERSQELLRIHRKLWPRRPARKGDDLLRSVVVLTVSALDSYLHDAILDAGTRILVSCSKESRNPPGKVVEVFKDWSIEKALQLAFRKRPDEEFRKVLAAHLRARSFQDAGGIQRGLALLGLTDCWERLRRELHVKRSKDAKRFVQGFVTRRHNIVHEADRYKSKKYRGKLREITRPYANDCVRKMRRFVKSLDKLILKQVAKFAS